MSKKKRARSPLKPKPKRIKPLTDSLQKSFQDAVLLFQGGRLSDAERLLSKINAKNPKHPNVLHLRAVVALNSGNVLEAATYVKKALTLVPKEPQFLGVLGGVLEQQGNVTDAIDAFQKSITQEPNNAEALYNLANLHRKIEDFDKSIHFYKSAVLAEPSFFMAHYNLSLTLRQVGRLTEAEPASRNALELQPHNPDALINLGNILCECDHKEEGIDQFRAAIHVAPDYEQGHINFCNTLLELGKGQEALAASDRLLELKPGYTDGLAFKSCALQILGKREELERFIDYPRMIYAKRIVQPTGYNSLAEFNAMLGNHLVSHPDLTYEPEGKSTRVGSQVNNLNTEPKGPIAFLEHILHEAYREYLEALDLDPEHPFATAAPSEYKISIFGTILSKGGYQLPHFHRAGWLSGVYYVEVPEEIIANQPEHSGCIEFGRLHPDMKINREPLVEILQPEEGLMLLFPSYFHHNTVPFTKSARRISIAFDFVPVE